MVRLEIGLEIRHRGAESAKGAGEESSVLPIGRGNIIQKAGIPSSSRPYRAKKWRRSSPTAETLLSLWLWHIFFLTI